MILIALVVLFALGCSVAVFVIARHDRDVQREIRSDLERWGR